MTEPDVIVDIIKRFKDRAEVPEDVARSVEADARRYWGGERCYIPKAGETPRRREAHARAERIRTEHRRGDHVPLLARRHELSERHVRRILGLAEAIEQPAANDPAAASEPQPRRRRRRRKPDTVLP